jgi:antitoxin (DNA-binding transcriptional repressor) of toxin-antitoxin stability system
MKTIAIETEKRPPSEWLPKAESDEIVYLTEGGRPRFIIVPLDEGDEEALAIQKNERLMAYVADFVQRARNDPTRALSEIKSELGRE